MHRVLYEADKLLESENMTYQFTWYAWGSHGSNFSSAALERHNTDIQMLNYHADKTISYQGFV